jgi:hypothetical protein
VPRTLPATQKEEWGVRPRIAILSSFHGARTSASDDERGLMPPFKRPNGLVQIFPARASRQSCVRAAEILAHALQRNSICAGESRDALPRRRLPPVNHSWVGVLPASLGAKQNQALSVGALIISLFCHLRLLCVSLCIDQKSSALNETLRSLERTARPLAMEFQPAF